MVDRDITGEIRRIGLNRIPALLGISNESLKELADRVRQFDQSQSDETRQRKALEKIAQSIPSESISEKYTRNDRRKREVEALELMAVAQAYPHEELRNTLRFKNMLNRLGTKPEQTREEEVGETRA
ncbi:hypothetical protein ACFY7C_19665 [Streptomyces sp. NPDC012769]|uniref:hypothetical protein n=1 Tax=Streptomyces sp. NPDC012769 TaxID=3364848 RepID=UPI0036998927